MGEKKGTDDIMRDKGGRRAEKGKIEGGKGELGSLDIYNKV